MDTCAFWISELFPSSLIAAAQVTLPVVITSLLEVVEPVALGGQVPSIEFQRTQTPTVRLDFQVYESGDELVINFDFDERWLREDVVRQLMTSFKEAGTSAKHAHGLHVHSVDADFAGQAPVCTGPQSL